MNEREYEPVDIQDFLPDIDVEKLKEAFVTPLPAEPPKVETIDFLLRSLNVNGEIKYPDQILRNYIYTTIIVRKHLQEISKRQSYISKCLKKTRDKSSYAFKKLQYFYERNQAAKEEIVKFISYGLSNYVTRIDRPYADLIDRAKEQNMWLLGPTYDYQYNSQFYDPEYDFSTYAKFYNIPGIQLLDFMKNIEHHIALKKDSPDDYYREIVKTVDDNKMLSLMSNRVSSNYHIHERQEIFETLATLFKEGKYLAFITMASIQLEGIFYELVCIKFGAKERQGTLGEKVEKAFRSNPHLMQTLYPYFAFDIPELRNEIAHKGIVHGRDLKLTAYELVLDLNCVLYLTERASTDKYKKFILIFDKLNEIENKGTWETYMMSISECLFSELYMSNLIIYEFFWELLSDPEAYDTEMDYYRPEDLGEEEYCLKDIVHQISDLVKNEAFWSVVLSACNDVLSNEKRTNKDIISFIEQLKDRFMGILDGDAKKICCQVNAKIGLIKSN